MDFLLKVLRTTDRQPAVWSGAHQAGLGGDDDAGFVRTERFTDQLFADIWPITVRGIDEVDAELNGLL